jgi:hypothetical protein
MLRLTQVIIFLLKKQNFCSYFKASQTGFVRKLGLKKEKKNFDLPFQEVFVLSGEHQKSAFLILVPCYFKYPKTVHSCLYQKLYQNQSFIYCCSN